MTFGPPRAIIGHPRHRGRAGHALAWLLVVLVVVATSVLLLRQQVARAAAAKASKAEPASYPAALGVRGLRPILPSARLSDSPAVTLVRDPASAPYYDDASAYDAALALWRDALTAAGARVTVRTPAQLADVREPLVVPAAPCLSVATRAALARAAREGTGALVSWMTGTRDQGCRPMGWGFLASIVGAGRFDTLGIEDAAFITVPAGGGLALGVPPGARLELRGANHVAVRAPTRDAHYADAWLNPRPVRDETLLDGALARGERPRVAYIGFELRDVADEPWTRAILGLLMRNALAHVAGIPLAAPEPWPGGHRAAAVLAQDVEDEFANAQGALDTLRAAGVRSTFFVVSDLAREHPQLTRALARSGELATHSDDHRRLGGAPVAVQRGRLARTHRALDSLAGQRVRGLRPPEEQFDAATLAEWQALGGTYVFANNNGRCACPELVEVSGKPMVLMARAVDDDFIMMRRARIRQPMRLADLQREGWEKVRELGGLFILSYHSNMLARPSTVAALGDAARMLTADSAAWLVTTGEVAEWWQARHAMRTTVALRRDTLLVHVRNEGPTATPAAGVTVSLPDGRGAREGATTTPGGVRVAVPALRAGESRDFTVLLEATRHAP
jgi:peptidoglycan/xylan/chitin deacetylase (PgdA/CDA1 family)